MSNKPKGVAAQFGRNLATARRAAQQSQEETAVGAGLHRTEIGLLERGERIPRMDTLLKVAAALDVEPGELLDGLPPWRTGTQTTGGFE